MAKIINTRSPFYIKVYHASLFEAELKLYIYEGVKDTTPDATDLKYTIQKAELEGNNYVVFEISELVRDYIETKYDGEYDSYAVWVNPVITAFEENGTRIISPTVTPPNIQNSVQATGTATGTQTNKLIDSSASFTSTVEVGNLVVETQSEQFANVTSVDSNTQLTLDDNLIQSGGGYTIYRLGDSILATDGYGYFEEGINPDFDEGLMMSEGNIYRVNDRSINIPVSAETTNSVAFRLNGETIYTKSISDNDNTDQKIQYIASDGNSTADSYIERVLESQGGVFENNTLLEAFEEEVDLGEIDEIYVNYTNATETKTKVLKVKTFDCSKYEPIRVTFVNKFGALQDMYFTRRSNESVNVKTEDYKASVMDFDFANFSYDTSSHQMRTLNLVGNESITLNTDYIDESCNEHIKQLMLSEQIWMTRLTDEEKIVPLKLKSNSLQLKKRVNDKLIQYTMEFDVAADIINNIR